MSHYGNNSDGVKKTPKEWLAVGKQIGELANAWSGRSDLIAYAGTELKVAVPALYNPRSAEIEVNTEIAFGKINPKRIEDLNDTDTHYDYPKAIGAIFHEACHARFSLWSLEKAQEDLTAGQFQALNLLEESRIEAFGIRAIPRNTFFLSACALEIVLGEIDEDKLNAMGDTRAMGNLAGLVLARIDAGVLDRADVAKLALLISDKLGSDLLSKLETIWRQAQRYDQHTNAENLYPLAIEWDKLISEKAKENGEDEESGCELGSESGKSGSSSSGSVKSKTIAEMLKEIENAKELAEISTNDKLAEQQTQEDWQKEAKARSASAKEREDHKASGQRVFGEIDASPKKSGSQSSLVSTRKPTSAERASAVKISKMLEKARYRNRTETSINSIVPPGRLRTGAVVQRQALRSKGLLQQVEIWNRTSRKHTDNPNLTIGVMVDISGSMGMAMNPMASTAWIMSEAGRRVQAQTAMVYFGSGVFPTLRKGQHLDDVKVYDAPDYTEKFDEAFMALDGELNLLHSQNARLLVIVSDACYTAPEIKATKKWLDRCKSAGVAVLWITYDAGVYAKEVTKNSDAQVVKVGTDITEVADLIGKVSADALTKAGTRAGR